MDILRQILSPQFLLRNSLYTSMLVGFACPLVGVYLVLRRLVFMGVALPQVSSMGVAVALSLPMLTGGQLITQPGSQFEHAFAFIGSLVFSLAAILILAFLERRGRGQPEGRLGTVYVVATAVSILLLSKNRWAEIGWLDLLKGEIITISTFDLALTLVSFAIVLLVLWAFRKEFLLVSFDRTMAITLRKNVVVWDIVLYALIGLTVSVSVLSVGPLISFGFLLIPALTAHLLSRNMKQFAVLASLIGGAASLVGFYLAYVWDLPVGPTEVTLLGLIYAATWLFRRIAIRGSRRAANEDLRQPADHPPVAA